MVKIPPINFDANHFLCTFISVSIACNIAWINQFEIHKQYPHDDVTNQKCDMSKRNTLSSVWKCLWAETKVIFEQRKKKDLLNMVKFKQIQLHYHHLFCDHSITLINIIIALSIYSMYSITSTNNYTNNVHTKAKEKQPQILVQLLSWHF